MSLSALSPFGAPLFALILGIGLSVGNPEAFAGLVERASENATDRNRAVTSASRATGDWKELTSVRSVCRRYPVGVRNLLESLDKENPGLANVREAAAQGKIVKAARDLLAYYRTAGTASWLRVYVPSDTAGSVHTARRILEDTYHFYGQAATVPRRAGGGLDWTYRGPTGDDEWRKALHRHFSMQALLDAYLATGNEAFARQLDRNLRDWIVHSWPYAGERSDDPFWGELGVSFRVEAWAKVFFRLQDDQHLQPGTRLLMLMSLNQHGDFLRNRHGENNLAAMQIASLALLAAAWPEFAASEEWMQYAIQTLGDELDQQVYPDGAQKELAVHYHVISLSNFEQVRDLAQRVGASVPSRYRDNLMRMYSYLAFVMRPNGTSPLNNDSDLRFLRSLVEEAADQYDEPQWRYVASNGREGDRPDGPSSRVFPWAGQMVSRSDWSADAHWSFFDVGPWGRAHQHNDKLHLSVHAGGRDLLVDGGRFAYRGYVAQRFRQEYAQHSRGHNVVMIDGRGQAPGPKEANHPLPAEQVLVRNSFDFAHGTAGRFGLEGTAVHRRAVLYLRDTAWVVMDRIETDRPREIETLWHFHPECTVVQDESGRIETRNPASNLHLHAARSGWEMEVVKGKEEPKPQGWYSRRYNQYTEAPAVVARRRIDGTSTFAWLIVPGNERVPDASIRLDGIGQTSARVRFRIGRRVWTAVLPLEGREKPLVHLLSTP